MHPPSFLALLASVLTLAGCPKAPDDSGPNPTDTVDTGPAMGCVEDEGLLSDLTWEVTAVPSVLRVRWTLEEPAPSHVAFQPAGADTWTETATIPIGGVGEALLVGAGCDREVQLRIIAGEGGAPACSPVQVATTGAPPVGRPELDLLVGGEVPAFDGYMLVQVAAPPAHYWAIILDGLGRFVWSWEGSGPMERLVLSPDGQGVMFSRGAKPSEGRDGSILKVGFDGEDLGTTPFGNPGIDFAVLPDGRPASIVEDVREVEYGGRTHTILGQALDVWTEEGVTERLWSVWDATSQDLETGHPEVTTRNGTVAEDWSHVNGMSYDAATDTFYLTAGYLDSVFAVDGATGENLWSLADQWGDWDVASTGTLIQAPHSARGLADGHVLVFNRYDDPSACSDATEIALDTGAGTAARVWAGVTESCLHVETLGNAERLADGATVVSWSSAGQLDVLLPDSSSTLRIALGLGSTFGYVAPLSTLYPTAEPD
ncbi:MAG: aryl-sulfate sulfotransferase [Pseudomonadota bacterium]